MNIGEITIAHAIPGRLRLKVVQLKNDPHLAKDLQQRLATIKKFDQIGFVSEENTL